jgi:aarF domain-containing kinase
VYQLAEKRSNNNNNHNNNQQQQLTNSGSEDRSGVAEASATANQEDDHDQSSSSSTTTNTTIAHTAADDDDTDDDDDDREYAARYAAFQRAQEQYTTNSHPELTPEERVWVKRDEKEIMQRAAERLAELETTTTTTAAHHHLSPPEGGVVQHQQQKRRRRRRQHIIHQRAAQRLLELCQQNRGVYIKVGQHLANLDYLLPVEYITTLSVLFDDNPVTCYEDVCAVITEDLGCHPDELFASFDPVPIASASLAQVHVAYEKQTGRKLAVKVQHRGLKGTATDDVQNLVFAVQVAERFLSDFTFAWLAEEIAPNVPKELDFYNEGLNGERAARHLHDNTHLDCVVPAIVWDKTSARVLTMEYEEGIKASDPARLKAAGLDPADLSNLVASVFASQIFDAGFVHCDPHEGNLLFRKNKVTGKAQLVLIDHGLYRELDPTFRRDYACLWKSLLIADIKGIYRACQNLGVKDIMADGDTYRLFAGVLTARPFDEVVERSKQRNSLPAQSSAASLRRRSASDHIMIRGYAQKYLGEIIALLDHIPRAMLMLLKTNDCLRHIDHLLGTPPLHTLLVTGEYATAAVYRSTYHEKWQDQFQFWLSYALVMTRLQWQKVALYVINHHRWWLLLA